MTINPEFLLIVVAAPLFLTVIGLVFGWDYRRRIENAMRKDRTQEDLNHSPADAPAPGAAKTRLKVEEIGANGITAVPGSSRERSLRLALLAGCAVHFLMVLLALSTRGRIDSRGIYLFMAVEILLSLVLLRAGRRVWAGAAFVYAACGFAIFPEMRTASHALMLLNAGQAILYPAIGALLLLLRPVRAIVSLLLGFIAFAFVQAAFVFVIGLIGDLAWHESITPSSILAMTESHHGLLLFAMLTQIAAACVFFWILGRRSARRPVLGLCFLALSGILAQVVGHLFHLDLPVYIQAATLDIPSLVLIWLLSWRCLQGLNRLRERQWLASEYDRTSFPWAFLALTAWGFSGGNASAGALLAALAFPAAVIVQRALVWRYWSNNRDVQGKRLVFLRVFGKPRQAIRLLESLRSPWRLIGSVDLILGTDIATFDVSPDALEAYLKRQFHAAYLQTLEGVDRKLASINRRLGGDGYYPIHQLRCFDSTWRYTVVKLIPGADAVLMDLRGFNASNRGCVYELTELVNLIDLDRVLLLVDRNTDRDVLRQVLDQAWANLREDSPNGGKDDPVLHVVSDPCALSSHLLRIASSSAWTGSNSGTCDAEVFPSLCTPN